jgi:glycosyltransferase involved in cell wall biosynthesis
VKALFEQQNYKAVIDSMRQSVADGGDSWEIRGWAIDRLRKQALEISVIAPDISVRRFSRVDIAALIGATPEKKIGFVLKVPKRIKSFSMTFSSPGTQQQITLDMFSLRARFLGEQVESYAQRFSHALAYVFTPKKWDVFASRVKMYLHLNEMYYRKWQRDHRITKADATATMRGMKKQPLISIITPVYNVDERWLRCFIDSVREQWYENWELCIADDCSSAQHIRPILAEYQKLDNRIKVTFREHNGGISEATNSAMALAAGDFIAFMDNDDELLPQTLFRIAQTIEQHQDVDFIYTDEDKIGEVGEPFDPFFKPGFSQTLLWSHNYITHFVCVSRAIVDEVGLLRPEYSGSQDYDFVLRATQRAKKIIHIPEVLYHWRTLDTSVAGDPRSKMYAYEAGRKAVADTYQRAGVDAEVVQLDNLGTYKADVHLEVPPTVLVVVARLNAQQMTLLRNTTVYPAFHVLETENFNDADSIIAKADAVKAQSIVFIDGVVPTQPSWITEMVNFTWRKEVGAIGGRIVDGHHRVLDAGITLEALRNGQVFEGAGELDGDVSYYFRTSLPRDIFAVTEQCMLIRLSDFRALRGFDANIPRGLQGVDLCARMQQELGHTTVWEPFSMMRDVKPSPLGIPRDTVNKYLSQRPQINDPFRSAMYPPRHPEKTPVIGLTIDSVSPVPGTPDRYIVKGWAADVYRHRVADVTVPKQYADRVTVIALERFERLDVSRMFLLNESDQPGFALTIQSKLSIVPVMASSPDGAKIAKVKVSKALLMLNKVQRLMKMMLHPRTFMHRLKDRFVAPRDRRESYEKFIANVESSQIAPDPSALSYRPLISIVMPVYNVDPKWLFRAVESVRQQSYDNWELCLADDHSSDPRVRPALEGLESDDSRISVVYRQENGRISEATNSALRIAQGEFVALMDNDDELPANALAYVVQALNENESLDVIYSDEDKIDERGKRSDPAFKPDYSPDLLLSTNYISHLGVYRRSLAMELGGFRSEFDGAQDYDFVLRATESTTPDKIRHISRVLYHWRTLPTSTAGNQSSKDYAFSAGQYAVQAALDRRGIGAKVRRSPLNGIYDIEYDIPGDELVSVIIPTKNGYDNIERCVNSILEKTTYAHYEILIADNGSTNKSMFDLYDQLSSHSKVPIKVLNIDIPFNFSTINNLAAQQASGRYLLFLNDDTKVIAPDWMSTMVGYAQQDRIGVVGAKLYYPNERIQHAGVVLGLGGVAGHIMVGTPRSHVGYFGRLMENANYYAVTAACCMIRAENFRAVGGFDESYSVAYNDVDLCVRIHDLLAKDNVWAHQAELYHFESVTRGYDTAAKQKMERLERESEKMRAQYGSIIANDPYYNENLTREGGDCTPRTS